jgi:hypothetical protein
MTFDANRFSILLKKLVCDVRDYANSVDPEMSTSVIAHLDFRTDTLDAPSAHICGVANMGLSNHQKIAHRAFVETCEGALQEMKDLVKTGVPAFDYEAFNLDVRVLPSSRAPRLNISVAGIRLWNEEDGAYTLMIKGLTQALGRLECLPKPQGRVFRIGACEIPAVSPEAAYRIFAAINDPDLFNPRVHASVLQNLETIFEIIQPQAAHAALLTDFPEGPSL